jgi:GntR family transcriptional repressor for pyruvate dehydrogenase complex
MANSTSAAAAVKPKRSGFPRISMMSAASDPTPRSRPRTLALELVDSLGDRIRDGRLASGDKLPTEAEIMGQFGVSRTVVREALSKLQASGLVQTRHGIGTFVIGFADGATFRIAPEQVATLRDVIAVLELRIGVETEAASLAAQRRTAGNLVQMRAALDTLAAAIEQGRDTVSPDFQFHLEIARATQNPHFAELMGSLGTMIIPRARLNAVGSPQPLEPAYLQRVNSEHESIFEAIAAQDPDAARAAMRTHLANSRERRRRASEQADAAA